MPFDQNADTILFLLSFNRNIYKTQKDRMFDDITSTIYSEYNLAEFDKRLF